MTRDGFSYILGFQNLPDGGPPDYPTRRDTHKGNFGSHFFIQPLRHAAITLSHTDTKSLLFARHLPMIVYEFVIRGFICSLLAELPLPPPFSPILLLLLLGYGYCYVKVIFLRFFFFFFCCYVKVSFQRVLLEVVNLID